MKKIIMILMIAFTMMTGLFADVTLLPKDVFDNYLVPAFENNTPSMQPQIAYVADTWEDIYEKTGVDKYSWRSIDSMYCDVECQYFLIIKYKENRDLGWICLEFPGDGSETLYITDAY